ncbi:unnamed protein product, partial [Leptidea sinapis]
FYIVRLLFTEAVSIIEHLSRESFTTRGIQKIWGGPLLVIGLTNPADIEYVSKNCLEKDLFLMKSVRGITGDGGIFAPVSIWSRKRKVIIPAFSPKILNSFMDIFSRRCADLVDKLKDLSGTGTFDISPIINNFTLASIAETSLGIRNLGGMNDVVVSDFLESVEKVFKLASNRIFSVWLWPDWIYKLSWQYRHFTKHNDKIINLTNNIIRKKRNELKHVDLDAYENQTVFGQDDKVDSFLDHLILLSQRQNGFTDTELREEITTFILAATDTTAIAICNTLLLLGKYPKIQEKVHEELVRVFENANEKLFKDILNDLKYLDMVLKESLPSSGYTIPVQTGLVISIWGAHRDPNYWGPDADCFKPERFEAGSKTGLFIPFSTGPRNCIVVAEEEDGPIPKIECKFSLMLKAKHALVMYLLLVSVVLLLWYLLFRNKRRRLYQLAELIPGIKDTFPFLGLLKNSYNAVDKAVSVIENISRETFKTGGIQKIWGGPLFFIALTNPADIEYVSKNCLEKDLLVMKSVRGPTGDGGIFAPVIPAFGPKILNSFMDIFSRRSAELVDKLQELSGTGTFDIWPIINNFTLASIAETSLSIRDLEGMNDIAVSDFLKSVEEVFKVASNRTVSVWLWPDWIYKLSWQYRHFTKHNDKIINLTKNIIRKKRNDLKHVDINAYENQSVFGQVNKVDSFLDHLILLSQRQNGFTDTELREEITTFILAATDTTAIAICNTLFLLGKYPKIQEKVHEELVGVFENHNEKLYKDVLSELKYLDMVLKESLRLYPPVPMITRKATEEIKLPSSGYTIPAQTGIIILIWGAHRDPNYWGPDADCFKPERFVAGGKTGLFIPFSTGPRNCIGYQYAMLTAKSAIASILRQFKVVTEEEDGPIPKIECQYSIMLKSKHGYPVRLVRR